MILRPRLASLLLAALPLSARAQCPRVTLATAPPLATTPVPGQPASSNILAGLNRASLDQAGTSLQMDYDDQNPDDRARLLRAFNHPEAWAILVDNQRTGTQVVSASSPIPGILVLQLAPPLTPDTFSAQTVTVLFLGDRENAVQSETLKIKLQKVPTTTSSSGWHLPTFKLTDNKKNPNLDVTGSLQSAVGATPQYAWTVLARYPVEHTGRISIFKAGPEFKGIASQQSNADPDSLKADAAAELDFPCVTVGSRLLPINLLFNPIAYEFERKSKSEAVLVDGQSALNSYQQKNSNLIVSAGVQVVEGFLPVNLNLNLGTEFGAATSRSVLNTNAHTGYSDAPLRAVAGADVYFNVPFHTAKPLFTAFGHYTVRSLFHPEPFQQQGVNAGNQFYSTKARHSIAVDLARTIVPGIDLSVQYRFGSLPPTFSFVDDQVTIGFEFLLGR